MYSGVVAGRSDDLPLRGSALRLVTFNVASIDGRIAVSRSTPSMLDTRWRPLDRFETVDALSLHGARVSLEGSNSFTGRHAPAASLRGPCRSASPRRGFPASEPAHPSRPVVRRDRQPRQDQMDHGLRWMAQGWPSCCRGRHPLPTACSSASVMCRISKSARITSIWAGRCTGWVRSFGVDCVVSDAGGVLNGVLLRSGLVDEIDIQFLPVVVGCAGAPAIFEGYDLGALGSIRDLELISAEPRPDASIFVRYAVR